MHPDEPSMEKLKELYRKLMSSPSTDENMKKISALEKQIKRRNAESVRKNKEVITAQDTNQNKKTS